MLKRVDEGRHPCWTPPVVFESVSYAVVEEGGISGLVKEVFDDLDKVCADVAFPHGCPQSLESVSYAAVEEDGTNGLVIEGFFMIWIRLVLMLYFFMVAHKGACQTRGRPS